MKFQPIFCYTERRFFSFRAPYVIHPHHQQQQQQIKWPITAQRSVCVLLASGGGEGGDVGYPRDMATLVHALLLDIFKAETV